MSSRWRKMSKAIFYVSLVVVSLGAFFTGIILTCNNYLWHIGLIILGSAAVVIPTFYSIWGMLLEFFYNSAAQLDVARSMYTATKQNDGNTNDRNGNAAELAKYKELLDSGAITQAEFDKKRQELGV